jgi:putative endonuclease
MPSSDKHEEGQAGEDMAVRALKKRGYRILERNFTSRLGEIDIVAEEKGCLVFVEVKKRNTDRFGEALYAIDKRKKRHMVRSALCYMKAHNAFGRPARFDVVGIDGDTLKIVKNAFSVGDDDGR